MDLKYSLNRWQLLILLIGISTVSCLSLNKFRRSKSKEQVIERYLDFYANELLNLRNLPAQNDIKFTQLRTFIWSSCSGPNPLVEIRRLEVSDPVAIPGNVTVSLDSTLHGDITAPLKAAVQVQRKVGFLWIDVPCINNIGSCHYDDLCAVIPFPPSQPCPEPFVTLGLPCNCPVTQGDFILTNRLVHVPDEHIPEFLARGQYSVRVQAFMGNQEIVCIKTIFALA